MTITFLKYPSLTNHYAIGKSRFLTSQLNKIMRSTEKIHGANVSIIFDKDLNYALCSRNHILTSSEGMFGGLFEFVDENIEKLKEIASHYQPFDQLHLWGELYGKGIQVMDYDEVKTGTKTVRFFNVIKSIDGKLIKTNDDFMRQVIPDQWVVPFWKEDTLINLINQGEEDINKSSLGGYAEGAVYQPVEEYEILDIFIGIKHKTEEYQEKKKVSIKKNTLSQESLSVLESLKSRVTKQRISNVLSHGDFEVPVDPKNYGDIIKLVQNDIITEASREDDVNVELSKKFIGKLGGEIVKILKEDF